MRSRIALLVVALALVGAVPASAAEVSVRVTPEAGVRLGNPIEVSGLVTEAGVPLAGRVVGLELRRHPFTGDWTRRATASSGADGRFAFSPKLSRNHRVRIRLDAPGANGRLVAPEALSMVGHAFVLPAFTLRFRQRGKRAIRIVQTYTVPRVVKLKAPTRFYVGPCRPSRADRCTTRRARLRATARTRRVRRGRYEARARVPIPASYDGRFRYVSCFGYSKGSGMGDPDVRCPRKSIRPALTTARTRP